MSRVPGSFDRWTADLRADPDNWSASSVAVTIETASINTRQERRDNHLRSDDFFDAANHPTITFQSRSVAVDGERLRIMGDLTIRGVTRPVVLEGEIVALTRGADTVVSPQSQARRLEVLFLGAPTANHPAHDPITRYRVLKKAVGIAGINLTYSESLDEALRPDFLEPFDAVLLYARSEGALWEAIGPAPSGGPIARGGPAGWGGAE